MTAMQEREVTRHQNPLIALRTSLTVCRPGDFYYRTTHDHNKHCISSVFHLRSCPSRRSDISLERVLFASERR